MTDLSGLLRDLVYALLASTNATMPPNTKLARSVKFTTAIAGDSNAHPMAAQNQKVWRAVTFKKI